MAKWYKVLETSYINDAIRDPGEFVQVDGPVGTNLEEASLDEVRAAGKQVDQPDEDVLENREGELNQRESEINDRENHLEQRRLELEQLSESLDQRAHDLDARERELEARESDESDKPIEKQNVAELRETAAEMGVEVPEGATKVQIRELIKAKQDAAAE